MPATRTRALAAVAALACGLALSAPAGAATIVGSNLPGGDPQFAPSVCSHTTDCAFIPQTLAGGVVAVPADGVITAFHAKVKSYAYLRFRVDRGTFAYHEAATSVYHSPFELHYTVPGAGTQVFTENVRVPVLAGDRVGADTGQGYWWQIVTGSNALKSNVGLFFTWGGGTQTDFELLVNAIVEPDADHDGYGDETQDCQRTDPAQHTPCSGGGGGGGGGNQPPPIVPPPKVKLPKGTLTVVHGAAQVETRCNVPADSNVVCSGAHATYAGVGPAALGGLLSTGGGLFADLAKAKQKKPKRPASLKVGSAKFRIAAGKHKLVKIPLNKRARNTLAKRGKLKVLLVTTLKLKSGKTSTTRLTITLRPAPKTHKPGKRR